MPVFTTIGAAVATAVGFTAGTTGFLITSSLVAAGTAGLLYKALEPDVPTGQAAEDPGVDARNNVDTRNRVPVLYGKFVERGTLAYLDISEDKQTLYSVIILGEGPITSIDTIYWDDLILTLDAAGEVTNAVDVDGESEDRLNGQINVQTYLGGATNNHSQYLTDLSPMWTNNHKMTNLAYAVVTVRYNRDKNVTNLNDMRFIGTAPIADPAAAVRDQLQNTRYGLGLPDAQIDIPSFTAATAYFQTMLPHDNFEGGSIQGPRFQVNGALSSSDTVKDRIDSILLGSNSSLRWSNGKYALFVDRAETVTSFVFNEDNMVGDVSIVEAGLNALVNTLEIRYGRNARNNWQPNEVILTTPTASRFPNEIDRVLNINLPLTATDIEARRAGTIILNQVRQQLGIKHRATIQALPLEPGDIVNYTRSEYGWTNKQFRIIRISEIDEDGKVEYEVDAVEYSAAIYTDLTFTEGDVAPNVGSEDTALIAAVTDLTLGEVSETDAVPNFRISWSVPSASLITAFDIYANATSSGDFTNSGTFLVKSISSPGGNPYTSGATIADDITGLIAGTYSIWVVGRSPFATSPPSNELVLANWDPIVTAQATETVYRFHENVVTDDPGAPTGADGTGGGWQEHSSNPHWQAVTEASRVGGEHRVLDFAFTGTSGDVEMEDVDVNQEIHFDFSGTPGERELIHVARPAITTFDFSGQAAEVNPLTGGRVETWQIATSGNTLAHDPASNEEFYIYLDGNSAETAISGPNGEALIVITLASQISLTQMTGSEGLVFLAGLNNSVFPITFSTGTTPDSVGNILSVGRNNIIDTSGNLGPAQFQTPADSYQVLSVTNVGNPSNTGSFDTLTLVKLDSTQPVFTSGIFGYEIAGDEIGFTAAELVTTPSTVRVEIPTEGIDETFTLPNSLSTSTALRNSLSTLISATTSITSEFTVANGTASGLTGITDGEPIITLTANDNTDHMLSTTFTNGGGDLSGSSSGSTVDGAEGVTATTIRIGYDDGLDPSFQDITFGANANSTALAGSLASVIDGHGGLTATTGSVNYQVPLPDTLIPTDQITRPVLEFSSSSTGRTYRVVGDARQDLAKFAPTFSDGSMVSSIGLVTAAQSVLLTSFSINTKGSGRDTRGSIETPFSVGEQVIFNLVSDTDFSDYLVYRITSLDESLTDSGSNYQKYNVSLVEASPSSGIELDLPGTAFGVGDVQISFATDDTIVYLIDREETLTTGSESNTVTIQTTIRADFDQPTITINEQGSGTAAFTVSTIQEGVVPDGTAGTLTGYSIRVNSVEVSTGSFTSASSSTEAAEVIQGIINGYSGYTSTSSGRVATATTATNVNEDISVVLSAGTNDSGVTPPTTSTNDLAVLKTETQIGSDEDVYGGSDAMATITIGTETLATLNVSGLTLDAIADAVGNEFATDGRYTATTPSNEVRLISNFTGGSPLANVTVSPGEDVSGAGASLAVVRDIVDDGVDQNITSGQLSTFSVTIGDDELRQDITIPGSSTGSEVSNILLQSIREVSNQYSLLRSDNNLRATNTTLGPTPDMTISIVAGLNADNSAANIAVSKTVVDAGTVGTLNLTNNDWNYFVINQEIRVDGDTTTMDDDNNILVRRGLINDTQTWDDISNVAGPNTGNVANTEIAYFTESITTGARPGLAVFQGTALQTVSFNNLGSQADTGMLFRLEASIDGGQTWAVAGTSFRQLVHSPTGTFFISISPVNFAFTFSTLVNTTYWFRLRREFQLTASDTPTTAVGAVSGNFLTQMLLIEELVAS